MVAEVIRASNPPAFSEYATGSQIFAEILRISRETEQRYLPFYQITSVPNDVTIKRTFSLLEISGKLKV